MKLSLCSSVLLLMSVLSVGCSQVNFEKQKMMVESISSLSTDSGPEIFEMGSTGIVEQLDRSGEIVFSGSVGAYPTMAEATDNAGDNFLVTGFSTILPLTE